MFQAFQGKGVAVGGGSACRIKSWADCQESGRKICTQWGLTLEPSAGSEDLCPVAMPRTTCLQVGKCLACTDMNRLVCIETSNEVVRGWFKAGLLEDERAFVPISTPADGCSHSGKTPRIE